MADFYALILDADFNASKPLLPLHVATQSTADFSAVTSVDPYQDFGSLNRRNLIFDAVTTQNVLNTFSGIPEGATVYGVSHR